VIAQFHTLYASDLVSLSAIRDEGLDVSSDMSLVGFDDIAIAHQVYPP
jgi:DNA-binding LacI/PurR family transcriptional regulator